MLNNREISILIWYALLAIWCIFNKSVRKSLVRVIKAISEWRIALLLGLLAGYVLGIVVVLRRVGVWDMGNLKDTAIWALTSAVVMLVNIRDVSKDEKYFEEAILDGFKISVVLEFVSNLYVFQLPIELILVPFATIIAGMSVIADYKEEYKKIRPLLGFALGGIGLGLIIYSGVHIYRDFKVLANLKMVMEFLLPILLTTLSIPYFYFLAVVITYEELNFRLKYMINDPELCAYAKSQLFWNFGINFRRLHRWGKTLIAGGPSTRSQLLASMSVK